MPKVSEKPGTKTRQPSTARGSNQSEMRAYNERLILSHLRARGPMAKAEIARTTGLSAQTASVIMRKLEGDGLIERCAPVRGKVGQPSVPMRLAPEGALFFGLKVGRRSTDLVLVDFLGRVIDGKHRTYRYPSPDGTLKFVQVSVEEITGGLSARQQERIAGLGIAIPGYLWEWAATIGEPPEKMAAWRDRDIRAEIERLYDFPVYLQNDASSACSAELVFGQADYPPEFLYFYVGYFVGGGVVLNGALFTGPTENAGAIGPLHVPTRDGGMKPLIDVASVSCLEKAILQSGGDPADLWETSASWQVDAVMLGAWLEQTAEGLALTIAASLSFIDFPLAVIDGWLPNSVRRDLVEITKRKLFQLDLAGLNKPEIREGTIGPEARALGAASLPLLQRFLVQARAF